MFPKAEPNTMKPYAYANYLMCRYAHALFTLARYADYQSRGIPKSDIDKYPFILLMSPGLASWPLIAVQDDESAADPLALPQLPVLDEVKSLQISATPARQPEFEEAKPEAKRAATDVDDPREEAAEPEETD